MASLTAFFTAAEQIDAAKLAMARALDDIRAREGTLAAAATLTQITTGEARKLLALLSDTADTDSSDDSDAADSGTGTGTGSSPDTVAAPADDTNGEHR